MHHEWIACELVHVAGKVILEAFRIARFVPATMWSGSKVAISQFEMCHVREGMRTAPRTTKFSYSLSLLRFLLRLYRLALILLHGNNHVGYQYNIGHESCQTPGIGGVACAVY